MFVLRYLTLLRSDSARSKEHLCWSLLALFEIKVSASLVGLCQRMPMSTTGLGRQRR